MRSSDPPEPSREGEHAETVHPDDVTLNPEEYQVLDTDDEDFAGLKQSIKQEGVNEPILLDGDRVVVDGHNRVDIARDLGLEAIPYRIDTDANRERAWQANAARRHMTKKAIAKQYLQSDWDGEESEEAIARMLGMSQKTVNNAKQELVTEGVISVDPTEYDTVDERRRQVWEYHDAHPDASYRDIAANVDADISYDTVRRYLEEQSDAEVSETAPGPADEPDTAPDAADDWVGASESEQAALGSDTDTETGTSAPPTTDGPDSQAAPTTEPSRADRPAEATSSESETDTDAGSAGLAPTDGPSAGAQVSEGERIEQEQERKRIKRELESHQSSLEQLLEERADLEVQREELPAPDEGKADLDDIENELEQLQDLKQPLDAALTQLENITQLITDLVEAEDPSLQTAVLEDTPVSAAEIPATDADLTANQPQSAEVACPVCSQPTTPEQLEATREHMQAIKAPVSDKRSDLRSDIDELTDRRESIIETRDRYEEIEERLDELDESIAGREEQIQHLESKLS